MTTAVRPDAQPAAIPIVNTHVHFPPNFSAFTDVADAVGFAAAEGVHAVGISNFFDQSVYRQFAEAAAEAGIVALFGLEFITAIDELARAGTRINDPANPGRMYLCGKGISPFKERSAQAERIAAMIRTSNDQRIEQMVTRLAGWFSAHGLETGLTAELIRSSVAEAAGVPLAWVSLQERHLAMAFQQALSAVPAAERAEVLARIYGSASAVDADDPIALQGELRSRLLKAGTPGFVAEVPLSFDDAYAYILAMDGIPTYPTLADGVSPVCPFEESPEALAVELIERGIWAAELIPVRNTAEAVDRYVRAFAAAGLVVMAGTEHNTQQRIPLAVSAADGPVSDFVAQAFWEGACVVAAHQMLIAAGRPGYVDSTGARTDLPTEELVALGASAIKGER
jgi:hypothetical protein